ncbi:MAG: endonuclease/exonuclease/phosphatase family protein [Candidatus Cryptobacteroides sp.]
MRRFISILAAAASLILAGCSDDDLKVPAGVSVEDVEMYPGEPYRIAGKGFEAGDLIVFESSDSQYRFQSSVQADCVYPDGADIFLPDQFIYELEYRVYLVRGIDRVLLGSGVFHRGLMQEFRVMSSNIRVYGGDSGDKTSPHFWDNRKSALISMYKDKSPDIIGIQEAYFNSQWLYLKEQLEPEGYELIGRSIDYWDDEPDMNNASQVVGIVFKKDRFSLIRWGVFSLSETPDEPMLGQSPGFGASYKRQATWAEFELAENGRHIFMLNTHLDTKSDEVRKLELELILARIEMYNTDNLPVFMTADWNMGATSSVFDIIRDSFELSRTTAPVSDKTLGTFNGWGESSSFLDHIWYSSGKGVIPLTYKVVNEQYDPEIEYYSDHWSIYSDFQY